jgi:surfactin synthase thioesterase subunit
VTGGGAIASSPALYAYFLASESYKIPSEKMSMTIIGALEGNTDKINSQVNLLQWVSRLVSLASPVK